MASTLKHLRSSTADKRPVASGLADGQFAINTASGTPAVFFKDSNGGVVKVGPAHVGASAPNAVPAGSAGNSLGELWVDNSLTTPGLNYYTGSAFVNLTPSGTTTTVGLVELATPAETQTGTDAVRAVTPSGLQSKVSDSTSTTSSTTIASSTAVKSAYDLANAALPKAGGTVTGELLIGNTGSLVFEGSTDDSFETTIAVVDPTADRTITFPNVTGTVVTTGDTGTVTSAMILDGTITGTDVASGTITSTNIADNTIVNADINSAAAITYSKLALSSGIVNTDVSASAAIAGTKISPDFGSQNIVTTGTVTGGSFIPTSSGVPTNGLYLPAANSVAISTNGSGRLFVDSTGKVGIGTASPSYLLDVRRSSAGDVVAFTGSTDGGRPLKFVSADNGIFLGAQWTRDIGSASGIHAWAINGTERMRITSAGLVGIGTSSPGGALHVDGTGGTSNTTAQLRFSLGGTTEGIFGVATATNNVISGSAQGDTVIRNDGGNINFSVDSGTSTHMRLDSSGRLGIGTTTVDSLFHVSEPSNTSLDVLFTARGGNGLSSEARFLTKNSGGSNTGGAIGFDASAGLCLTASATTIDSAKNIIIDSAGRLLVGTSSAETATIGGLFQVQGTGSSASGMIKRNSANASGPYIYLAKSRGTTVGSATIVQSGDSLGEVRFAGADGSTEVGALGALIKAEVDGTPGANSMPGRLVFSTATNASPSVLTERMRITSAGLVGIGTGSPRGNLEISTDISYGGSANQSIYIGANNVGSGVNNDRTLAWKFHVAGDQNGQNLTLYSVDDAGATNAENSRVTFTRTGVGIGTTSPDTPLHVNYSSANAWTSGENLTGSTNIGICGLRVANASSSASAEASILFATGDSNVAQHSITSIKTASFAGDLVFRRRNGANGSLESLRVDSSGRLLVGTSSSLEANSLIQAYKSSGTVAVRADSDSLADGEAAAFDAFGGARSATLGVYKHAGITNPCAYIILKTEDNVSNYFWVDNSDQFRISTTATHIGTTSGTVVGTQTSDERLKNILGPVEYGLDTIKQIEPVRYTLKSEPDAEKLGFIAQQVQPLVPQSVFDTNEHIEGEPEDAPTKLGMEYVSLIPVLVNAIKELSAEVDALKAQLS